MSAIEIQEHLNQLKEERALALTEGLGENSTYMAELQGEIAAAQDAYVGVAVTEIVTLRGELFGRPQG